MGVNLAVISACSGRKSHDPVVDCTDIDTSSRAELLDAYPDESLPAELLYTGDEHRHVTAAVDHFEDVAEVEWRIISAGFGLVTPDTVLPSYECTFSDSDALDGRITRLGYDPETLTRREQIQLLSRNLGIPDAIRAVLSTDADLAFVVLGADYLIATDYGLESLPKSCSVFAFAAEGNRDDIGACEWVPSTEVERAALHTTWTQVKGLQLRNLAKRIESASDLQSLNEATTVHEKSLSEAQ